MTPSQASKHTYVATGRCRLSPFFFFGIQITIPTTSPSAIASPVNKSKAEINLVFVETKRGLRLRRFGLGASKECLLHLLHDGTEPYKVKEQQTCAHYDIVAGYQPPSKRRSGHSENFPPKHHPELQGHARSKDYAHDKKGERKADTSEQIAMRGLVVRESWVRTRDRCSCQ